MGRRAYGTVPWPRRGGFLATDIRRLLPCGAYERALRRLGWEGKPHGQPWTVEETRQILTTYYYHLGLWHLRRVGVLKNLLAAE